MRIQIDGSAPLQAIRYEVERLRCSACGLVFTASAPVGKHTPRAKAVLVVLHYSLALPFKRLENFQ